MIHYHGSPCSGPADVVGRFYAARHAMVSFAYPDQLDCVANVAQSFALDNGAFTAWRQGGRVDVPAYKAWVKEWSRHPGFAWCLIPDVVDGTTDENDALIHDWETSTFRIPSVPVWHFHESEHRLRALAGRFDMVALGSSGQWPNPGTQSWWDRLGEVLPAILDEHGRPYCKLHGLRMLSKDIFPSIPLASADSTNAAQNAGRMTKMKTAWQEANYLADQAEAFNSAACWEPVRERQLELFA